MLELLSLVLHFIENLWWVEYQYLLELTLDLGEPLLEVRLELRVRLDDLLEELVTLLEHLLGPVQEHVGQAAQQLRGGLVPDVQDGHGHLWGTMCCSSYIFLFEVLCEEGLPISVCV